MLKKRLMVERDKLVLALEVSKDGALKELAQILKQITEQRFEAKSKDLLLYSEVEQQGRLSVYQLEVQTLKDSGVLDDRGGIRHPCLQIHNAYIWNIDEVGYRLHSTDASDAVKSIFEQA